VRRGLPINGITCRCLEARAVSTWAVGLRVPWVVTCVSWSQGIIHEICSRIRLSIMTHVRVRVSNMSIVQTTVKAHLYRPSYPNLPACDLFNPFIDPRNYLGTT